MLLIDEIAGAGARQVGRASIDKLTITVRELLHMRVELEWRARSEPRVDLAPGKSGASCSHEARLNRLTEGGVRGFFATDGLAPPDRRIDKMCAAAEQAFLQNRLFVLLDDSQADSLDQAVEVARTGSATFLLLTPLQGG